MNGPGHMTKMAATLRHFHSREINDTSFGQCVIEHYTEKLQVFVKNYYLFI